jgi:hypothetical protein
MALWQNFRLGEGIYGDSLMLDRSDLNSDILGWRCADHSCFILTIFKKARSVKLTKWSVKHAV